MEELLVLALVASAGCAVAGIVAGARRHVGRVLGYAAAAAGVLIAAGLLVDRAEQPCDASDCWNGLALALAIYGGAILGIATAVAGLVAAVIATVVAEGRR